MVYRRPTLILLPCPETGSSQTSLSKPVIGPALGEVASQSMEVHYHTTYPVRGTIVHPVCFLTEPFEDEVHPRLRFPHRGLVACANNGTKNSNDSQFFITLGLFLVSPLLAIVEPSPKTGQKNYTENTRCSDDALEIPSTVRSDPALPEPRFNAHLDVVKIGAMGK